MTRIFLVGLMGSGKTTVGKLVADALGCPYLDNDDLLRDESGSTLADFAARDSAALHAHEAAQVRRVAALPGPYVAGIAASAADRPADLALLASSGTVVYLRCTPETLARRLGSAAGRPWLQHDPSGVLAEMFERRDEPLRRAAHVTVDSDELDPAATVAHIVQRLPAIT